MKVLFYLEVFLLKIDIIFQNALDQALGKVYLVHLIMYTKNTLLFVISETEKDCQKTRTVITKLF